ANPPAWSTALIPLRHARFEHVANRLPGGRVLLAGGEDANGALKSAEVWNPRSPAASAWTDLPSMSIGRLRAAACPLNDGRVLVSGGRKLQTSHASAEIFDPYNNAWYPTGSMADGRYKFTCTTLEDGRVLVAGGLSVSPQAGTEIFEAEASSTTTSAPGS